MRKRRMTNKEWLSTLSAIEWKEWVDWLIFEYGEQYADSYKAVLAWLDEEHTERSADHETDN